MFLWLFDSYGKATKQERYEKRCMTLGTLDSSWKQVEKLLKMAGLFAEVARNKCKQREHLKPISTFPNKPPLNLQYSMK